MAQSEKENKKLKASVNAPKSTKWVIHKKIKDHAQKVKNHVKKHHKKYV